eukprot:TRINITY_DN4017_c0_g1_i1.p1 TRINITY_DN4017_c0_g1~~TRINITY_DN4017_c0_g1_i1.p1  ORF type:complete len:629 (+),score=49.97 TRINITY_DN4017_c0_g1_i1:112-1998(+)
MQTQQEQQTLKKEQKCNWQDNVISWFLHDFWIASRKLRSEIQQIEDRRSSVEGFGILKEDYTRERNFSSFSTNLDDKYIIQADRNFFLPLDSCMTLFFSLACLYVFHVTDFSELIFCKGIESRCYWIGLVSIIILIIPEFFTLAQLARSKPVSDNWVLLWIFVLVCNRIPWTIIPFRNCNLILVQFWYGLSWSGYLWLIKVGNDMFWQVIIYRVNFVVSVGMMLLMACFDDGSVFSRVSVLLFCSFVLLVATMAFVVSALIIDGELERFTEGRSFINLNKDRIYVQYFVSHVLLSAKRNIDYIYVVLFSFAFLMLMDSYVRLLRADEILLAQIWLVVSMMVFLEGAQGSSDFVDDLIYNIQTCDSVVVDLIPKEFNELLTEKNLANGVNFRSASGKSEEKMNGTPQKMEDLLQLVCLCRQNAFENISPIYYHRHRCVTVLMMDIVGFTSMSNQIGAMQTMAMLNKLYYQLDILSERLGVYKVETIGDCYVVVGGLFSGRDREDEDIDEVDESHANRILLLAASIHKIVEQMNDAKVAGSRSIQVRVGIHSGGVCSAIMGHTRKRYCLFGEAVNTAGRMETLCPVDSILISASAYSLLGKNLKEAGVPHDQNLNYYIIDWRKVYSSSID